jgi:phosphate transport system substrate-binding protein
MSVSKEDVATIENSFKPFAAYLALRKYPLVRDVYIIMSDFRGGLPSGFMGFATGEKGQRIVLRAGLVPGTMPTRLVKINQTLD